LGFKVGSTGCTGHSIRRVLRGNRRRLLWRMNRIRRSRSYWSRRKGNTLRSTLRRRL
jgi:hypothetical protein